MKKGLLKNWIIPTASVLLMGVVLFYLIQLQTYSVTDPVYFYIAGTKATFTGDSQLRKEKDQIVFRNPSIQNDKKSIGTQGNPLFFENQQKMMLTATMEVVVPKQNKIGKLEAFTEIKKEGNRAYALLENQKIPLDQGFLFNGKDTYVFLEQSSLEMGDKIIDLAPFSLVVALEGQGIEVYPANSESYTVDLLYQEPLWIRILDADHPYSVHLTSKRIYDQTGEKMLFTNPETLPLFKLS